MGFLINSYRFVSGATNGLLNNLVSYYKADTNGSFPDAHGTNNGTINGATYTASGKINGAYDYDGVNDYVVLTNPLTTTFNGDFSISFWYYNDSTPTSDQFIFKGGPVDLGFRLKTGGILEWQFWNGTSDAYLSTSVSISQWYHVVITRSKTTGMILYINRISVGSNNKTYDANIVNSYATSFGALIDSLSGNRFWFNGKIDDAGFWNKSLTPTEVTALFNSGNGLSYDNFTT